jgi:UDP-N-acetyl-D-mannosaminuronate dehydrogenase
MLIKHSTVPLITERPTKENEMKPEEAVHFVKQKAGKINRVVSDSPMLFMGVGFAIPIEDPNKENVDAISEHLRGTGWRFEWVEIGSKKYCMLFPF